MKKNSWILRKDYSVLWKIQLIPQRLSPIMILRQRAFCVAMYPEKLPVAGSVGNLKGAAHSTKEGMPA